MSGKIVGEVLRYAPEDLTETQFRVLLVLAESAPDKTRQSRTNTAEIAHMARRSPGTVRNAITELTRRALIRPVHEHSKIGRGRMAQDYRIAQLEAHHRATTLRPVPAESVTPEDDTEAAHSVTPRDDAEPCGQLGMLRRIASLPEPNSVIARDDTLRKDSPVTTVGSYSSKQEPRARDPREVLPPSLRSVANGRAGPLIR